MNYLINELINKNRSRIMSKVNRSAYQKAINILEKHQEWRMGNIDNIPCTPSELTEAINLILTEIKKTRR